MSRSSGSADRDHVAGGHRRGTGARRDLLHGKPAVDHATSARALSPESRASGRHETLRVQSGLLQSVPRARDARRTRARADGAFATLVYWNCLFMLGAAVVLASSAPAMRRGAVIQGAAPLLFLVLAAVRWIT